MNRCVTRTEGDFISLLNGTENMVSVIKILWLLIVSLQKEDSVMLSTD